MFTFDPAALPALADLDTAAAWAVGGALAGACASAVYTWYERGRMVFGTADEPRGLPPEVPGLPPSGPTRYSPMALARGAIVGAVMAVAFGLSLEADTLQPVIGAGSVIAALFVLASRIGSLLHDPAGRVPVGEAPPAPDEDDEKIVTPGTWAAVGAALAGLALAAIQLLIG